MGTANNEGTEKLVRGVSRISGGGHLRGGTKFK